MVVLAAAKQVSPLIKFARWTALLGGIVYGFNRYKFLASREIEIQKHETQIRTKYAEKKGAEKILNEKLEMEALGKEAGVVAS